MSTLNETLNEAADRATRAEKLQSLAKKIRDTARVRNPKAILHELLNLAEEAANEMDRTAEYLDRLSQPQPDTTAQEEGGD